MEGLSKCTVNVSNWLPLLWSGSCAKKQVRDAETPEIARGPDSWLCLSCYVIQDLVERLGTYYVPSTILITLHGFSYLILKQKGKLKHRGSMTTMLVRQSTQASAPIGKSCQPLGLRLPVCKRRGFNMTISRATLGSLQPDERPQAGWWDLPWTG